PSAAQQVCELQEEAVAAAAQAVERERIAFGQCCAVPEECNGAGTGLVRREQLDTHAVRRERRRRRPLDLEQLAGPRVPERGASLGAVLGDGAHEERTARLDLDVEARQDGAG